MNDINKGGQPGNSGQGRRRPKNTYTTKSGKQIKVNQSIGERVKAKRSQKAATKAAYLATLPKNPVKRFFARIHPKRFFKYWFSREGAIMALKIAGIAIIICFFLSV